MVQAAARKVVDFSTADVADRRWWARLWLMLDQVEVDNAVHIRELQHAHNRAVLDYGLGEKAFGVHWAACEEAVTDIWNALFPWNRQSTTEQDDRLAAAWSAKYGDPSDPEVQERIRRTAQVMKEMREKQLAKKHRLPKRVRLNNKHPKKAGQR